MKITEFAVNNRRLLGAALFTAALVPIVITFKLFFFRETLSIQKILRFNYTFTNASNELIKNTNIEILAPANVDGLQQVKIADNNGPYALEKDSSNRQVIKIALSDLAPYASRIVTFTLSVTLNMKPDRSDAPKPNEFVLPAPLVESGTDEIKHLAASLKVVNRRQTAKNVYEWLINNVRNEAYTAERRGALFVINKGTGDCTEFMYAFVALMRANGIPTRGVSGYFLPRAGSLVTSSDRHEWAEFYDGNQWVLVDAEKKNFDKNVQDYVAVDMTSSDIATNFLSVSQLGIQVRL